jgi:hypothetical protein
MKNKQLFLAIVYSLLSVKLPAMERQQIIQSQFVHPPTMPKPWLDDKIIASLISSSKKLAHKYPVQKKISNPSPNIKRTKQNHSVLKYIVKKYNTFHNYKSCKK